MTAFARYHVPTAIRGQKRRHAQTGTWTEHDLHTLARLHRRAQRPRVCRAEVRQGPRDGFEIIQHAQLRKSEALSEFAAPKPPARAIGQHDFLAVDRTGNGQRCRARVRARLLKIACDRRIEVRDRIVLDDQYVLEIAGGIGQRKPALAAANIGDKGGVHSGYSTNNHLLANQRPHPQAGTRFSQAPAVQYDRGRPRTCSARYDRIKLVEIGAV